jgi:hypothetical protein
MHKKKYKTYVDIIEEYCIDISCVLNKNLTFGDNLIQLCKEEGTKAFYTYKRGRAYLNKRISLQNESYKRL